MWRDRAGRTDEQAEDTARHAYAKGAILLRATADRLSELCWQGKPVGRSELRSLHWQVHEVYQLLYSVTLSGMGSNDWSDEDLDAYHDTYSDGLPVSSLERTSDAPRREVSDEYCEGDIPWSPNVTGVFDGIGDVSPRLWTSSAWLGSDRG